MDWFAGSKPGMRFTEVEPFSNRSLSVAPGDVDNLRKQVKVLEDVGIIKRPESLKVPEKLVKHNMSVVFSPDYYNFKNRVVPDLYSEVNIENALNSLVGNKVFSILGLESELCQIPMYPGERERLYSVRPLGYYESERWQPGYCETLATFQSLMSYNLRDLNMHNILVYLDYVIVFGKTYEKHKQCLERVLDHLTKKNWKISLDRSFFCGPSFSYAGHEVSAAGIAIDPSKLKVVSTWPKPRTVTELRCFLDFCRYYQQFLAGFPKTAKPLSQLLRKALKENKAEEAALAKQSGRPWWTKESVEERWTKECDEAFKQLKDGFSSAPVLARANMAQNRA